MEKYSVIGKRLPRVDALEKVTGRAKYGVDLQLPGMIYGKILRSKYPHAKIISVDVSEAERLEGVKAVVTADDLSPRKVQVLWPRAAPDVYLLARDKVRYVGDEIAGVAAVDEETAEEALEMIKIQYEELPAVFDAEKAMEPNAPRIHDFESNIINEVDVEYGNVDKGFREAHYTLENKFTIPYVHQCHLEPTACLADFDGSGKLTLWITSMDPFVVRHFLAEGLDIPESKVRVIQPYIGGAYGAKTELLRQYVVCALLAKKVGRPVRIVNTREEEFTSTRPLMPLTVQVKIGVKRDGTFIALHINVIADAGAYSGHAPTMLFEGVGRPTGLYKCPNVRLEGKTVYTNKVPVGPYRSYGSAQVMFGFESVLDMIAEKLGIDPTELRLKNAHKTGDVTILGSKIDSCGIEDCIGKTAEYTHWREKKTNKQPNRGIGIACSSFISEARVLDFGGSVAFTKILEDGRISIISGELDWGQGTATIFRQIAAEELGVSLEDVDYSAFDTDVVPFILGPYGGGRNTVSGGNAVKIAANDAKKQILSVAGEMLEANVEDLEMRDRRIYVKGSPERGVSYPEIAKFAIFRRGGSAIIGKGVDKPDTVARDRRLYGNATRAYPFTAQIAEVEVDRDTGRVRILSFVVASDVGRAINPLLAEGQMQGAIAQGLGAALMEEIMCEEGVVMNPNFTEYNVPTVFEVPSIKTFLVETNDPHGPYGAKAIGMLNMMPVAAALANAIYDAVGVRIKELPIAPDKVLRALEEKEEEDNAFTGI